jgi:hypothetical protein
MKYKFIQIILVLLAFGCGKKNYGEVEVDSKSFEASAQSHLQDSITITCNNKEQKLMLDFNIKSNNFYTGNSLLENQIKCLFTEVNKKNPIAINQAIAILDNINKINPFLSNTTDLSNPKEIVRDKNTITKIILNQNWRGETIFAKIIEQGNVHGCLAEPGLNCGDGPPGVIRDCINIVSIHQVFYDSYKSMIRSIDGMTVKKYLEKKVPYTPDRARQDDKEKCKESIYRDYYNAIKEAYSKGLVVLKDYGEE